MVGIRGIFSSVALSTHTVAMLSHQQYGESISLLQLEQQRLQTWRWGQSSIVSGVIALGCFGVSFISDIDNLNHKIY